MSTLFKMLLGIWFPSLAKRVSAKMFYVALVVITIVALGWFSYNTYKTNKAENKRNANLVIEQGVKIDIIEATNKSLAVDVETVGKSAKITEDTIVDTNDLKQSIVKKTDTIKNNKNKRQQEIEKKYETIQKVVSLDKPTGLELSIESETVMNNVLSMWESYCAVTDQPSETCKAPA